MKVGWLMDRGEIVGGAELTQQEQRDAAPDDIEIVNCPVGEIEDCDRYVIQNCVTYTLDDLKPLEGKPVTKFWHDVGPWIQPDIRRWLAQHATHICCSPIQAEHMGLDALYIPPPVNLDRFSRAAENANGRDGAVCVGSWRNYGKAPHKAAEWGAQNGGVDFFGGGPMSPPGSTEVTYDAMPDLLAQYKTFVFLPVVLEPFGRLVAEAWAAGCECVVNDLVGAKYWIEQDPGAIKTAAEDFWEVVLA